MLSLLTLNIGAAALDRADKLLAWLAERPEDVFLLTETSAGPGTAHLLDQFQRAGFAVVKTPDAGDRGAALVSRVRIAETETAAFAAVSIGSRVAAAVLDTDPQITVASVYVPSRDRSADKTERKERFIGSLLQSIAEMPAHRRGRLVIGGDYNVIARTHQPPHAGFLPFEYGLLETLNEQGFIDTYAHCRPGVQAHSWIGRTGDGYRYDYFHAGPQLRDLIEHCEYVHQTREQRLTDHAAESLTLRAYAPRLETTNPADSGESTLF